MSLPLVSVVRFHTDDQGTSGILRCDGFQCFTFELPWYNNINNFSCIPAGEYFCKYTKSPHLKKWTYEVLRVPKRAGIRIHAGNYAGDKRKGYKAHVLGCFILCKKIVMPPNNGQRMGTTSGPTVQAFEAFMGKRDFILNVSWVKE